MTTSAQHTGAAGAWPRPRVVWLTNLAAPYRLPVWRELSSRVDLTVLLLESAARLAADHGSNRGADWAPEQQGLTIAEVPTARLSRGEARYYLATRPQFLSTVGRADAVVLGGWESPAYWQAFLAARRSGVGTVGFYESTLDTQGHSTGPIARARTAFFRGLDRVVVPGPAARDAVLAMGVDADRVLVGFNAVDTDAFQRARSSRPARATGHSGHRFVYVGQLIARKRVDAIIDSFARVAGPDDTLRIIGRGELADDLHRRADIAGVASRVSWSDYVPNAEMPDELAAADTLVLASDEEVWGLVVNEALAAGLQVVVTRNCGVVPSVEHMAGVFVAPSSSELDESLRRARDEYRGPIAQPEILQHTPQRFAHTFLDAIEQAIAAQQFRPRLAAPSFATLRSFHPLSPHDTRASRTRSHRRSHG